MSFWLKFSLNFPNLTYARVLCTATAEQSDHGFQREWNADPEEKR